MLAACVGGRPAVVPGSGGGATPVGSLPVPDMCYEIVEVRAASAILFYRARCPRPLLT